MASKGLFGRVAGAALAMTAAVVLTGAGQRVDESRGRAGAEEIVRTENAFAQQARQPGQVPAAFEAFAGREAIMFAPDPVVVTGRAATLGLPDALVWRPDLVAVASSGDLGASAGPAVISTPNGERYSYYVSVWRRQAPGWRFILDTGVNQPANLYTADAVNPDVLIGRGREGAGFDLQRMESDFARDAARNARRAVSDRMEDRGRVLRDGYAPGIGRRGAEALLQTQPATMTLRMRDGSAAGSGDLAYAWGEASWTDAEGPKTGYYVHVWRRDGTRWRLVVDALRPRPPAQAAAPAAAATEAPLSTPAAPAPDAVPPSSPATPVTPETPATPPAPPAVAPPVSPVPTTPPVATTPTPG